MTPIFQESTPSPFVDVDRYDKGTANSRITRSEIVEAEEYTIVHEVLTTTELSEQILVHLGRLSYYDLVRSRGVCHFFKDTIDRSYNIRRELFLAIDAGVGTRYLAGFTSQPTSNVGCYAVAEKQDMFIRKLPLGQAYTPTRYERVVYETEINPLLVRYYDYGLGSLCPAARAFEISSTILHLRVVPGIRQCYLNPSSLCLDMFISRPPIRSAILDTSSLQDEEFPNTPGPISIYIADGIRLSDVVRALQVVPWVIDGFESDLNTIETGLIWCLTDGERKEIARTGEALYCSKSCVEG